MIAVKFNKDALKGNSIDANQLRKSIMRGNAQK